MNPVFEKFMQSMPLPGPLQNIANVVGQFSQFANSFRGDPQTQVQQLLQSGKMSQADYQQYQMWANKIYPLIKGRR